MTDRTRRAIAKIIRDAASILENATDDNKNAAVKDACITAASRLIETASEVAL